MEESRMTAVSEALAKFVLGRKSASQFHLKYPAENSPEFLLTVLPTRLVLLCPRVQGQLLKCVALNSASHSFYLVLNAEGEPEVHCNYMAGNLSALGALVDHMAKWFLCYQDSLLACMDIAPSEDTERLANCFLLVAERLQVVEYTFVCELTRLLLRTAVHFSRDEQRFLTLKVQLHASGQSVSVRVRSAGNQRFPASPHCVNGRIVLLQQVLLTDFVPSCAARTVTSFLHIISEECRYIGNLLDQKKLSEYEPTDDPDLRGFASVLQELGATGCTHRSAKPFSPHIEKLFPDEVSFSKAVDEFRALRDAFRFKLAGVHLSRVRFHALMMTVDISNLASVETLLPTISSRDLHAIILNLIQAVEVLKTAGFGVLHLKSAWYVHHASAASVLLPSWSTPGFKRTSLGDSALHTFAALKQWKDLAQLCVRLEDLPQLFPLPVVAGDCSTKVLFAGEKAQSISLLKAVETIHWEVFFQMRLCKLQSWSLALLYQVTDTYVQFALMKQYAAPLTPLCLETPGVRLVLIGEMLVKAHEEGCGHLMLSPKCVKWDATNKQICLTGFKHNVYRIVHKYVKRRAEPAEVQFLDHAVLSYIWWKRDKSAVARKKREKYIREIDLRCDVYGFAMLIYSTLGGVPFEHTNTFEEFFHTVVKPHRRPLICEAFERQFPEFTDVLRRSWEAASLRPSMKELLAMLQRYDEYAKVPARK